MSHSASTCRMNECLIWAQDSFSAAQLSLSHLPPHLLPESLVSSLTCALQIIPEICHLVHVVLQQSSVSASHGTHFNLRKPIKRLFSSWGLLFATFVTAALNNYTDILTVNGRVVLGKKKEKKVWLYSPSK